MLPGIPGSTGSVDDCDRLPARVLSLRCCSPIQVALRLGLFWSAPPLRYSFCFFVCGREEERGEQGGESSESTRGVTSVDIHRERDGGARGFV